MSHNYPCLIAKIRNSKPEAERSEHLQAQEPPVLSSWSMMKLNETISHPSL